MSHDVKDGEIHTVEVIFSLSHTTVTFDGQTLLRMCFGDKGSLIAKFYFLTTIPMEQETLTDPNLEQGGTSEK